MRKATVPLLLLVLFAGMAGAQSEIRWHETPRVGIAVEDAASAPLVNLAALGVGNSAGIGWSGYYDGSENPDNTFHASLGWLSYGLRRFDGVSDHEIGVGFPIIDGFYLGSGVRWIPGDIEGVNAHMLYRPLDWLSVGVKGESLNKDPWMDFGAGLRPLMFSDYWRSRFTLFYDGRVNPAGGYDNIAAGLRTSPVDGVEIYGHWDFRDEKMVAGLNLSWNRLTAGGEITALGDTALAEGNTQLFVSAKAMRGFGDRRPTLVVYDAAEIITDTPRPFGSVAAMGFVAPRIRSLYEFLADIERLAAAPEVDAVLFDRQAFVTSFSNLVEIGRALEKLKDAGKEIYFYDETMRSAKYAMAASVADGIFLAPQGALDLTGFGATKLYFKDLLAEYGVDIRNFRSHEYKTAFDTLTESSMSDAQRESLESIYGVLQELMDGMILDGRGEKLAGGLEALYEEGFWMSARRAERAGLVDGLMYADQLEDWMEERRWRIESFSQTLQKADYEWHRAATPNIAVIYANGGITRGDGRRGASIGSDTLAEAIRQARLNPFVDAIVLRVNSGGGSALASDLIAREVALCTEGDNPKPVVVSMGGMAASGGYMISAPATRLIATPASLTGSIGVIVIFPDISGLLEKFHVESDRVVAEGTSDSPNIFRPLTAAEEQRLRDSVMERYDAFAELVAENRGMSGEAVDAAARGRVWTGAQAMEMGLVDELGGFAEAVEAARTLIGAKEARVVEVDPGRLGRMMPGIVSAFLGTERPSAADYLPDDLNDLLSFYKSLTEYEEGEALYLLPYSLEEMGLAESE